MYVDKRSYKFYIQIDMYPIIIASPTCMKNSSCHMSSRKRYCHYPTDSCDDCTYMYACSLNKYQVEQIDGTFYRDQKERIRMDSDSSSNSDSDDLCSSTSVSSVKAPSEYPDKENVSSPIRRSKLQSFAFCHRDLRGEASTSEADQADFKQENINTSLLITDCKLGPQIPSSVLPYTSSCSDSPLLPQTVQHPAPSTKDESENEFSDKQKDAILKFLNDSSEDDLCDIRGCSLTKAKLLIQHLPLSKWEDLVNVHMQSVTANSIHFCTGQLEVN